MAQGGVRILRGRGREGGGGGTACAGHCVLLVPMARVPEMCPLGAFCHGRCFSLLVVCRR